MGPKLYTTLMYLRWQHRWHTTDRSWWDQYGNGQPGVHWSAILVENKRINGKPRQQHVAYLAGFSEGQITIPAQQRFVWDHVKKVLDRLGNRISAADRQRFEATIAEKIGPPPTQEQREELDRRREELQGSPLIRQTPG
jgi:hypothetical protein